MGTRSFYVYILASRIVSSTLRPLRSGREVAEYWIVRLRGRWHL